jgi:hypothetical protein
MQPNTNLRTPNSPNPHQKRKKKKGEKNKEIPKMSSAMNSMKKIKNIGKSMKIHNYSTKTAKKPPKKWESHKTTPAILNIPRT